MAQVSVRGVGGRGSERLRAEASRLRRPTKGRVVLRAASSFLPAFSQSSAPILRPVRLLGGAATCGRVVSDLGSSQVVTGFRKVCVAPRRRRGRSSWLILSPACVPTGLMWYFGGTRLIPVSARAI